MWAVDTHCHLDRYPNPAATAREAMAAGIFVVAVTNLPSHFFLGLPHAKGISNVRLAIGLHPMAAAEHSNAVPEFQRALSLTSFVGEIGLDMSAEGRPTRDKQALVLSKLLPCLLDRPRFVTLHSRGAEREILAMLRDVGLRSAAMHWYSGPIELLDAFISDGHYFSVNPAMIEGRNGRRILSALPRDRVLTESDGPHTRCGSRQSKPADIRRVVEGLAKAWQVPLNDAAATTVANFRRITSAIGLETK